MKQCKTTNTYHTLISTFKGLKWGFYFKLSVWRFKIGYENGFFFYPLAMHNMMQVNFRNNLMNKI